MAEREAPALERATAQERYTRLQTERNPYLERARACAKLSIPALIPEEGDNSSQETSQPLQRTGARGATPLAAKLMLALFPPGHTFFRLSMEEYVLDELISETGAGYEDAKGEFDAALSRVERTVITRMEHRGYRATLNEVMKHLIVAGNVLIQIMKDGGVRLHPLSAYVVKRDKAGNAVEMVIKETVARVALPEGAREVVEGEEPQQGLKEDGPTTDDIDIYTRVLRKDSRWEVYQEVLGKPIPGSEGTYPLDKCPWIPLRLIKVDGEDYGRGFVEQYIGDLRSLEALAKAIVMFTASAAKILVFVDDNGRVTVRMVSEAESGDVLPGNAKDVTVFQLDKFADFRVAKETMDDIRQRLEEAFLLFSGVRRDAERVTAEEIRAVVQELEQSLGGIYSVLGQELQAPIANVLLHQMARAGDIPRLPDNAVRAEIISGVDALGRTADLNKLREFRQELVETFGPEAVANLFRQEAFAKRVATAVGLNYEGLIKTEEELQAEQEAAQAQAMAEKVGPEAVRQAGQPSPEGEI